MLRLFSLCALISIAGCQCYTAVQECTGTCLPLDSFCAQLLSAQRCNNRKACGRAVDLPCNEVLPYPTYASLSEACPVLVRAAVDAGHVKYDEDAAAQCLQSLSTQCVLEHPGCKSALVGTLAVGEACRTRYDCTPDSWCDLQSCPGTCRAKQPAGSDVASWHACASDTHKALPDGGYRCHDYAELGGACDPAAAPFCGQNLACASDGGCVPAPFQPMDAARGERCTGKFQGIPLTFCLDGLACHITDGGTEGTCRSRYELGESCTADAIGCVHNAVCEAGICVPLGAAGDGCVTTFDCKAGLACRTGRCGARASAGATCKDGFDCQSELRCVQGKCAVPLCAP